MPAAGGAGRWGRLLPAGATGVLLELGEPVGTGGDLGDVGSELADAARVAALAAAIRERVEAGEIRATDVVAGARTVLVEGSGPGDRPVLGELLQHVATAAGGLPGAAGGAVVTIPTVYDGPDLAAVAARWGIGVGEVAGRHAALDFQAAFCGFAPGFAYLAGLPAALAVPRRGESRARVPAGSVGLAGPWCGIYPRRSPGGWQLIGRTSVTLFDAGAEPPALLAPGTRVRFVAVDG